MGIPAELKAPKAVPIDLTKEKSKSKEPIEMEEDGDVEMEMSPGPSANQLSIKVNTSAEDPPLKVFQRIPEFKKGSIEDC